MVNETKGKIRLFKASLYKPKEIKSYKMYIRSLGISLIFRNSGNKCKLGRFQATLDNAAVQSTIALQYWENNNKVIASIVNYSVLAVREMKAKNRHHLEDIAISCSIYFFDSFTLCVSEVVHRGLQTDEFKTNKIRNWRAVFGEFKLFHLKALINKAQYFTIHEVS